MEKYNPLENIESARIIADAAKPLIDIAREDWVNNDQKKYLDEIAIKRGEMALNKEINNNDKDETEGEVSQDRTADNEKEKTINREKIITKMIEIIENSPSILFIASGRGNLLNKDGESTVGFNDYFFDYKLKKMVRDTSINPLINLDALGTEKDQVGIPQFYIRDVFGYKYLIKRLPISVPINKLLTDYRPGQHYTSAIRYKISELSSLDDESLKKELENPQNADLLNEVLNRCSQKYIPDYYNSVVKE